MDRTAKTAHSARIFRTRAWTASDWIGKSSWCSPRPPCRGVFALLAMVLSLAWTALSMAAQSSEVVLPKPIEVRTKTAEGAQVRGMLERWDASSFTGTFGTRRWNELAAPELNRVYRMLMDERNLEQWMTLGELLIQAEGGERMSDAAFSRARRLNKDAGPAIEVARARGLEKKRIESERRLRDILPEGGWSA